MTTYIATIKRLRNGEIVCQRTHDSVYAAAEYLFLELQGRGWTGTLKPTVAKLHTGQPIMHDGFEYVITRKVEVALREPTHRGRLEQLLRDMDVDFETVEHMTGLTLLLSLGPDAGVAVWFDADGSHVRYKP